MSESWVIAPSGRRRYRANLTSTDNRGLEQISSTVQMVVEYNQTGVRPINVRNELTGKASDLAGVPFYKPTINKVVRVIITGTFAIKGQDSFDEARAAIAKYFKLEDDQVLVLGVDIQQEDFDPGFDSEPDGTEQGVTAYLDLPGRNYGRK
jgi:hypothetical protein